MAMGCQCGRVVVGGRLMASSLIGINSASDETLMRCVARRDERAMRILFARHHRRLFLFLIRAVKSIREVTEIVGVPEPTVKTRMFYARRRIVELMRAHGTSHWQIAGTRAA